MTTAITLAGWFLIFGAYAVFAFGMAVLIGKAMSGNTRIDDAERAEVDGSLAQFSDERQRRANRAVLAQRDRWSRSA